MKKSAVIDMVKLYKIILEGVFTFSSFKKQNEFPAGFFTTRHLEAVDAERAIELAKQDVIDELKESFPKISRKDIHFIVDSCEMYSGVMPDIINKGFTFYSKLR